MVKARVVGYATPPPRTVVTDDLSGGAFEAPTPDVWFADVEITNVDFSTVSVVHLSSSNSQFNRCKFDGIKVDSGRLAGYPGSEFSDCTFSNTDLRKVIPGHATFLRCSFAGARIYEWFTHCSQFVDCVFDEAEIVGTNFSGKPLECFGLFDSNRRRRNAFTGNDFRTATLVDTSFVRGIDLRAQQLPQTDDYVLVLDARKRIAAAKKSLRQVADRDARRLLLDELSILEGDAHDGQRDLFVTRADITLEAESAAKFWNALGID